MTITHYSEFSGVGGTSDGVEAVPGVVTIAAANHDKWAITSHALNFPHAEHFQADITKLPIDKMPWAHLATFSPACPAWTTANGIKRDFDRANAEQPTLFDLAAPDNPKLAKRREEYKRSRLLMREIPRYLRSWVERGRPVPIGFLENVIQVRLWDEWDTYLAELHKLDYHTRLIAFNSMHAQPRRSKRVGQSRNRAYLAWWHRSLGRAPDWDKWLRPKAWCPQCMTLVDAMQVFKKPGADMGCYRSQWVYQCPTSTCRGREVHPEVLPALDAIDLTIDGIRLGDRESLGMAPLAAATMERIATGVRRFWMPLLVPTGGTWRGKGADGAVPVTAPMGARTTRECDGIAVPPLMVPVEGRPGKTAAPAGEPLRTQATRNETGLALPFITPLRGGGDKGRARRVTDPLSTVTAAGNHHGLVLPPLMMRNQTSPSGENRCTPAGTEPMRTLTASSQQELLTWARLLVPYFSAAESAYPVSEPMGALTTRDRYGVANVDFAAWGQELAAASTGRLYELLADVRFRMLEPHEVAAAMGFRADYKTSATSKRVKVRLFGNAVTPCVAELLTSALVECLTGEDLPREAAVS